MKLIVNRIVAEFNKIFAGTKRVGDSLKLEGRRMSELDVANASTLGYKSESSLSVKNAVSSDKAVAIQSFSTNGNAVVDAKGNPVYIQEHQLSVNNSQNLRGVQPSDLEVDIARRLKVGSAANSPIINVSSLIVDVGAYRVKDSSLLGGKSEGELNVLTAGTADNALKVNNKLESELVVEKSRIAGKLISNDIGSPERYESQLNVNSAVYVKSGSTFYTAFGLKEYILGLFAATGDTVDAKKVYVDLSAASNTLTVNTSVNASGKVAFTDIMAYIKDNSSSEAYKATRLVTSDGAKTGNEYKTWLIDHNEFSTKVGTLNANTANRARTFGADTGSVYTLAQFETRIVDDLVAKNAINATKLQNKTPEDLFTTIRSMILSDASNGSTGLTQSEVDGFIGNAKITTKIKAIKVTAAVTADTLSAGTTWAGSTTITNVGTITNGTWNANIIPDNKIPNLTGKTYNGLSVSVTSNTATLTAGTSALSWGQSGSIDTAAFKPESHFALSDHVHGNITNDGKVGSTTGLPLVTSTGGLVTAGAWGTPVALGASASAGSQTTFARSDHVHPKQSMEEISNVSITSKSNNDLLQWNGTNWVNVSLTTTRNNLNVYSKSETYTQSEVNNAIDQAKLALGTNYSVANNTERDALTNLTVGDNVFVSNDGDNNWAIYKVTSTTPTFVKIMDVDLFLNMLTTEQITKLDGIEAGAQVNTVTSVAGKTGAVTVTKADVGLGSVLDKTITVTSTSVSDGTNTFEKYVHPANHDISVITGLQDALDGKSATTHNHDGVYEPADTNILKSTNFGKTQIDALGIDAATVTGKTVGVNVPTGAKFTDTTYTLSTIHYDEIITVDNTTTEFQLALSTDPVTDNLTDQRSNFKVYVDGVKVKNSAVNLSTDGKITIPAPTTGATVEIERTVLTAA